MVPSEWRPAGGSATEVFSMAEAATTFEEPWQRQQLHVPRADETLFAKPNLRDAPAIAGQNHLLLTGDRTNIQGRTLGQIRRWSREQVYEAARTFTAELTGADIPERPFEFLVVAGHQPTLFHPGVWVKNFALGELTAHAGALGLNLIIDNDTFSSARIRVPAGEAGLKSAVAAGGRERPVIETIPFDEHRPTQPWEDARILDRRIFESFGKRVAEGMRRWNIEPISETFWQDAIDYSSLTDRLADCLSAARSRLERRWGLENLELPISRLCALDPFLWFAGHLLAHLPRFCAVHNEVLREYRRVNRVRSRTHPVPELESRDGWFEAPFWVWRSGDLKRGRVFARQRGRTVELSAGTDIFATVPLSPEMDACCAVEALRELPGRGIHLRTRALTTTLFARLCLADLFIHGIGGSKYDEMTDRIIARFFSLRPPAFLTLSATLHLPLAEPFDVQPSDATRLQVLLRDLEMNPDRHLEPGDHSGAAALIAEKRRLIEEQRAARTGGLSRSRRRWQSRVNFERFRRFRDIDRQLATCTASQRQHIEGELETVRRQLQVNSVLQDREYAFCLYPEEKIRPFMSRIWQRG